MRFHVFCAISSCPSRQDFSEHVAFPIDLYGGKREVRQENGPFLQYKDDLSPYDQLKCQQDKHEKQI